MFHFSSWEAGGTSDFESIKSAVIRRLRFSNFISGRFDEMAPEPFVGVSPMHFAELLISVHGLNLARSRTAHHSWQKAVAIGLQLRGRNHVKTL